MAVDKLRSNSPLAGLAKAIAKEASKATQGVSAAGASLTARLGCDAFESGRKAVMSLGSASSPVEGTVRSAKQHAIESQLSELKNPGDSWETKVGAYTIAKGIKGGASADVQVRVNDDGKYVLSLSEGASEGLFKRLGPCVARAEGEASLGGAAKVEWTFDSAAEAAQAVETLGRVADTSPTMSYVHLSGTRNRAGTSAKDTQFLADHLSAIELDGERAARLSGKLGLRSLAVEGGDTTAVRLELKGEGGPQVVLKERLNGEVTAKRGVELDGKFELEAEKRWTLPSLDAGKLLADPEGALAEAQADGQLGVPQEKVTLKLDRSHRLLGDRHGVETVATCTGAKPADSVAIASALRDGDLEKAIGTFDQGTQVRVQSQPYTSSRTGFSPNVIVKDTGAGLELEVARRRVDEKAKREWSGSPSDVLAAIKDLPGV